MNECDEAKSLHDSDWSSWYKTRQVHKEEDGCGMEIKRQCTARNPKPTCRSGSSGLLIINYNVLSLAQNASFTILCGPK